MSVPRISGDSIGEAVTTYDTAIGIQSPKPDAHWPWRPPYPKQQSSTYSRTYSRPYSGYHSRNVSESRGLLQEPQNVHGYSTAAPFTFDQQIPEKCARGRAPPLTGVPQSLQRSRQERWKGLLGDFITIIIATPYLLVVGECWRADGHPAIGTHLVFLEEITKIVATLFPLVFSAMVGRAMIKFASWKLEQGTTLGLLEELIGSRTVLGTIKTQVRLRHLRLVSLGLVLLWLLSPFGSQAAQRIFTTALGPMSSPANITYINTRQPSYAGDSLFQDSWFTGFATLFSASLLAPEAIKTGTMDLWGNVKVPLFSSLSNLPEDKNGWRGIPKESFTPSYSALFGIPTSGLPPGNSTFNLESTYLELTCSNITSTLARTPNSSINPGLITPTGQFRNSTNTTDDTSWAIRYLGNDMNSFILPSDGSVPNQCLGCLQNNFTSQKQVPGMLVYQDFGAGNNVTSVFCVPSQIYVESSITCSKTPSTRSCAVVSQRLSVLPNAPAAVTLLSFSPVFNALSQLLPQSASQSRGVDLIRNYIIAPLSNNFIQSAQRPRFTANISNSAAGSESDILNVQLQDFSIRLSQIINTFLQGSTFNSTSFLTGSSFPSADTNLPLNISSVPAMSPSELSSEIQRNSLGLTVPGATIFLIPMFVCHYYWAAILLVAALAMLAASISAAVIRRKTLTRDYLPYVSSLVCESQFTSMPRGGVRMDGLQRARKMRDLKVRLGDVGEVGTGWGVGTGVAVSVGQLAVSDWGGLQSEKGAVVKGKLYV